MTRFLLIVFLCFIFPATLAQATEDIPSLQDIPLLKKEAAPGRAPEPKPLPQALPEQPITWDDKTVATLRTIDKVSARTGTFDIPVGKTMKFGKSLFIRAEVCRKSGALDKPESSSFLRIWERKPDQEKPTWVFSGWMFASSPSLSAMDHPVYDVWLVDCKNAANTSAVTTLSDEAQPDKAPVETAPASDDAGD